MKHDSQGHRVSQPTADARFFQFAPDACCILDDSGVFRHVNRAFTALTGIPEPELVGRDFREFLDPADRFLADQRWQHLRSGAGVEGLCLRFRCPEAFCSLEWSLSRDPADGGVCGVVRACRENVRLAESEDLLTTFINALPDAINFKDGAGRWLLSNPAMLRVFGLEGVDYVGKRDSELSPYSPFFHECFLFCEETDEAAWGHPGVTKAEETIPRPDGSALIFESLKVPLFNADGSRKGLVVIGRDITERRRLDAERAELVISEQAALAEVRAARELDALKNAFVNSVSHELRTPLTSILGYAEFLIDGIGGPLTSEQADFAAEIEKGAKRLGRLIDDLLDFARIEAGTLNLRFQNSSLNAVVEEVMISLQPQALGARLALQTELAPDLPRSPFDTRRIEQVLINLVGNAVKFTPPGGRITVRTRHEGTTMRCEVHDTGAGIPADEMPKLFQRFSQLREGLNMATGTGLGLSIAKSIVEAHGGVMGVESTPGKGSVFWFQLPLQQQP